ncbi:ABC transporter substrate-binding protein [Avibacterium sp. 21-586]|uniref:heme/hemin ABC transporter substrate-binding protein n=1 Tax=Avibacterium sp. 21-586 TaxID=2911534 RepID=UPI00224818B1|nr:ABC transporter substrate-binding protein [Avibacterium sp. 21-586]MCW9710286.1 ABC transporter substrate-binding protein [Avibacterium sp. 21-586]
MKKVYSTILISCALFLTVNSTFAQITNKERIVSVGAGITELLVNLDSSEEIVALDSTSKRFLSDRKLPIVGYQRNLSAEGIISLKPSILIGSEQMGPDNVLQKLKQAGIKVEVLQNTTNSILDLQQHIIKMGEILGKQQVAKQLFEQVQEVERNIQQTKPTQAIKALFLFIGEKGQLFAGGDDTTANGILQLINMENRGKGKKDYYPYSIEALLAQQPKILFISERSLVQNLTNILQKNPFLMQLSAVQNQCVFTIDGQALLGGFNLTSLRESERLVQLINQNPKCH